ncbi:uncharacterized protein G2W53_041395 [Senna tora]|uniref:Uncharacterized protein n=1 Tax=Senna tora TaxID=362788 RepID=A0A834SF46_9FABA|nr:uncharacterized protein G2W53_041395 [Senna tora]
MGLYKNVENGETTMVWKDSWIPGVKMGELNPVNEEARQFTRLAIMESWEHINLTLGFFCEVQTTFWKSVWKLPVQSRFKVMRACLGIIPTVDALERRGMQINEPCVLCGAEPENVFHMFFECQAVRQVWETTRFNFSSWQFHNSILEWMSVEWGGWEREKQCVFIMAVYYIWEARNKKKFANETINLNGMWAKVERQWDEVCVARNGIPLDVDTPSNLLWEKPRAPYLKLNTDAATKSTGEGALGGVIRDSEGLVHGVFMASAPSLNHSTLLEALAIKKGVEVAQQLGVSDLVVESDARLVTDMLNSNCNHASLLSLICLSILDMCIGFNDVQFQWPHRSSASEPLPADVIVAGGRRFLADQSI